MMVSKNQNKIIKNRNGMYFFYDKNNMIKIGIKSHIVQYLGLRIEMWVPYSNHSVRPSVINFL